MSKLDSIANEIKQGDITFEAAALKYSDDPSKINGGLMINPSMGNTKFKVSSIDPNIYYIVSKMNVGNVSAPVIFETDEGNKAYRILSIVSLRKEHIASLKEDYSYIQELALQKKQNDIIKEWITQKKGNVYIDINENYKKCNFQFDWIY